MSDGRVPALNEPGDPLALAEPLHGGGGPWLALLKAKPHYAFHRPQVRAGVRAASSSQGTGKLRVRVHRVHRDSSTS